MPFHYNFVIFEHSSELFLMSVMLFQNSSAEPFVKQMEELTDKCQLLKTANNNLRDQVDMLKESIIEKVRFKMLQNYFILVFPPI